jgi:transposase-like protein
VAFAHDRFGTAGRFRREAGHRLGLRYSPELRLLAVQYATMASAQGMRRRQIAESLGVSEPTLVRWQEEIGVAGSASLHEVVVVERAAHGSNPVLVMPSGARVEGLSVPDLLRVLETLG